MDALRVLDSENCSVISGNKAKKERVAKGSKMGSPPRKRLADISNLQQPPKLSKQEAKSQWAISLATTEYIDKLHKENMTLMKVLAERNKIIELSGIELQKLRINLQKVQQQNLQLARANSQMLAELNSGKDRLRALQHELGCKNGLLRARKFLLESKAKTVTCVTSENQVGADKHDEAGEFFEADKDNKPCNTNNRRKWQLKNKSFDSSIVKPVQAKKKVDNKRLSLRRQSSRFKSEEAESKEERLCERSQSASFECEEPEQTEDGLFARRQSSLFPSAKLEPTEDLFEINDAKFPISPLHDEVGHKIGQTSSNLSVKKEYIGNSVVKDETPAARRRLSGRPLRQAAEKVQSYKEIPLNVKMRRLW